MKYINSSVYKVLKTAIAATIAIKIAEYFEIRFFLTAGIVAIISLQGTIRETFKVGVERIIATSIGLAISSLLFYFLGYTATTLGLFILIFMPICLKFNLIQGFLINVVLATHIISEGESTIDLFFNEFFILIIGLTTSMVFNLFTKNLNEDIEKVKRSMGKEFRKILLELASLIKSEDNSSDEKMQFTKLKELGDTARKLVFEQRNNSLLGVDLKNPAYFRMRYVQYKILKRMKFSLQRIESFPDQSLILVPLIEKLSYTTFDLKNINEELEAIEKTKIELKNTELPKSREEFESRAILYGLFIDLEEFATVALEYLNKYPKELKKIKKK